MYSRFPKPWFPYLNFLKIQLQQYKSSVLRNVLSVHPQNQFLNSDVIQPSITTLLGSSMELTFFAKSNVLGTSNFLPQ